MIKQYHLYIKGDVIGVGFRAWTKIQAKMIGITGWVRNVYDKPEMFGVKGGVEAVFQGEEEKLTKMIEKVKQGPPIAYVEKVDFFEEKVKETFKDFKIIK